MKKLFLFLQIIIVIGLTSCNQTQTLENVSSRFTQVDGLQVHYKVYGEGETSLVFVHGWGCDINAWSDQFDYFKDNYQLVFVDLPGYGKSDKPEIEYTLDLFAKSVKTVTDELNINSPVLIGHSLGFPVCKVAAKLYTNNEPKLCNVDGVVIHFPSDSLERVNYDNMLNGLVSTFAGDTYQENVLEFVTSFIKEQTPENVKDYMLMTMTQTPQYVGHASIITLTDEKYWTEDISEVPTLSVYARNEDLPDDHEEYLRFLFPNTTYHEMDGVGHFLMMEKPEEFNKKLESFLSKN